MSPSDSLATTGEDQLVSLLTKNLPQSARTLHGPGDDCAVLQNHDSASLTLFKTDCLVAGIHFTMDTDPARVGAKALNRTISDIAAMGGQPTEALVTLALPPDLPLSWPLGLYKGLRNAARRSRTGIAGGETSSLPKGAPPVISIALLGTVAPPHLILRSTGQPSHIIAVTGRLGGSIHGHHLDFKPRLAEAQWLAAHGPPSAMMDLSDGLAKDLPRLAAASRTGWHLLPQSIPRNRRTSIHQALSDGEDYELLATFPPAIWPDLSAAWRLQFPKVPLTAIGTLTSPDIKNPPLSGGWDHFPSP